MIGQKLSQALRRAGAEIRPLSRGNDWNPVQGFVNPEVLRGVNAVIHLAGEPIAARRWTTEQKRRIRDSRVKGTRALAEALAAAPPGSKTLICASAVGLYGDRGDEIPDESSSPGEGFLAEVVKDWEAAAAPAIAAGVRVVFLRLGVVLSTEGGALAKMLPVFRLGLGGRLGDGKAWMSWVHLDDAVAVFRLALERADMSGAYNLCAPNPVTNRDFTSAMGLALHRPTVLPVPRVALKLLLGEMGETLLLHSSRVLPGRLQRECGFSFAFPRVGEALDDLLKT